MSHQWVVKLTMAMFVLALAPLHVQAASFVGIGIVVDGKHVAGTAHTWLGETPAEIWQKMKKTPLTLERDFVVPTDPMDKTSARLKGKIELRHRLRGDITVRTTCKKLELVRRGKRWYVSDADVDRTMKAAGLKMPPKKRSGDGPTAGR